MPLTPEQLAEWRSKILRGEHPSDEEAREIISALRAGRISAVKEASATKRSKAAVQSQEDLDKLFNDL